MRDIPNKSPGDQWHANEQNDITNELKNIIQNAGLTLTSSDLTQLSKAVSGYVASSDYYIDTGSANNHILNASGSFKTPVFYSSGMRVRFKPTNSNTAPSFINVVSLGAVDILDAYGNQLSGGEIIKGTDVECVYDGSDFRLKSSSNSPISLNCTKKFTGCELANNAVDFSKDIDFKLGFFRADNAPVVFHNKTTIVKRLDSVWAAGTGNGGRASSVALVPNREFYSFYLAKADGTIDAGFDDNINASNLLFDATNYDFYALRGSVFVNASSNLFSFYNIGDVFYWREAVKAIDPVSLTTGYVDHVIAVPTGRVTEAQVHVVAKTSGTGGSSITVNSSGLSHTREIIDIASATQTATNDFNELVDVDAKLAFKRGITPFVSAGEIRVQSYREFYK